MLLLRLGGALLLKIGGAAAALRTLPQLDGRRPSRPQSPCFPVSCRPGTPCTRGRDGWVPQRMKATMLPPDNFTYDCLIRAYLF